VGLAFDLDGDGTYETEAGPATSMLTTFATAGPHEVGVQARDDEGLRSVSRESVQVDTLAGAPFEISPPAGPVRPGVAATYSAPGAVAWDMDADGAFDDAVGEAPAYAFAAAGTFAVRARTAAGRVAMRTVTVVGDAGIAPAVTALDLPPVIAVGAPTRFSAAAVDPEDDPVTLTFDLDGDGVFDEAPSLVGGQYVWTFSAPGTITIAVRATDPTGRSGVRTAEIEPTALALAPAVGLDIGPLVALQTTPLGADVPSGATVAWDTDGDGAFDDPATFTPPAAGEYTLRARVAAAGGGMTTVARTVTAGTRPPVATFSSSDDTPAAGEPVTLTGAATDPDGTSPTFAWDLDDDGTFDDETGKTVSATFAAGDHVIGLEARDPGGDVGIRYARLTVLATGTPTPTATATATVTATATATETATATPTITATATPTATAIATTTPTPTATASPTATATPAATALPTAEPTPSAAPRPTATPGPRTVDRSPPALAAAPRSETRTALLAHGLRVDARCSEACTFTVVASVDRTTARRLGLGGTRELGQVRKKLGARARTAVGVRLSTRARRAVGRARSLRISLAFTAVDAAGNRTVASAVLAVRRR
jgi:hypothetical protein